MQPDLEGGDRIINEQIKGALHATSSAATINRSVASRHSSSTYTFQNKYLYHNGFPTNTHPHYLPAQQDNYHYTAGGYASFYGGFTSLSSQCYPPLPSSFQTTNYKNKNNNISAPTQWTQHAAISHGSNLSSGQPSVPSNNGSNHINHSDNVIVDHVASQNYALNNDANYCLNNSKCPLDRLKQLVDLSFGIGACADTLTEEEVSSKLSPSFDDGNVMLLNGHHPNKIDTIEAVANDMIAMMRGRLYNIGVSPPGEESRISYLDM